jgi:hypothetical protein
MPIEWLELRYAAVQTTIAEINDEMTSSMRDIIFLLEETPEESMEKDSDTVLRFSW